MNRCISKARYPKWSIVVLRYWSDKKNVFGTYLTITQWFFWFSPIRWVRKAKKNKCFWGQKAEWVFFRDDSWIIVKYIPWTFFSLIYISQDYCGLYTLRVIILGIPNLSYEPHIRFSLSCIFFVTIPLNLATMVSRNPTIFNIIGWDNWSMEQSSRRLMVQCLFR